MIEKRYSTKVTYINIEDGMEISKADANKYYQKIKQNIYYEEEIQTAKNVAYQYIQVIKNIICICQKRTRIQGEFNFGD